MAFVGAGKDAHRLVAVYHRLRRNPALIVIVAAVITALSLLVFVPLVSMLLSSVRPPTELPFLAKEFTFDNYIQVFADDRTYRLLINTFLYVGASLIFGLAIALPLVWLVERTDMPFQTGVYTLLLVPLAIPAFIGAFGAVLLYGPRAGLVNEVLRDVLGGSGAAHGPIDIFTFGGMVFVTGLSVVPTMFLLLAGLVRNLSPQLEEASATSGGNQSVTFRRVTFPLLRPGIVSVLTYYLVAGLDFLEVPIVLGPNARFPVLSLEIFSQVHPDPGLPLYGIAAVYGLIAIVIAVPLVLIYQRVTRSAEKYAVITGKEAVQRRVKLGRAKYVALGGVFLYLAVVLLPIIIIVWSSFLPFVQEVSLDAFTQLTLANYTRLFENPRFVQAAANTVVLFLTVATITMTLASLIAWLLVRFRFPGRRLLEIGAFVPLAIPGVIIALAIMLFYLQTPLWGTIWIIALGLTTRYLPIGLRFMHAAQLQIHGDLEQAAALSGGSPFVVLRRITLPLLRASFANGWLFVAAHSMRDFTFPLILISLDNLVLTTMLWELWERPSLSGVSALSTLLIAASLLLVVLTRFAGTRRRTS